MLAVCWCGVLLLVAISSENELSWCCAASSHDMDTPPPWCVHCKEEMVILTLLGLSQLQLNDIMSPPTLSYPILLRLKACGQSVGSFQ